MGSNRETWLNSYIWFWSIISRTLQALLRFFFFFSPHLHFISSHFPCWWIFHLGLQMDSHFFSLEFAHTDMVFVLSILVSRECFLTRLIDRLLFFLGYLSWRKRCFVILKVNSYFYRAIWSKIKGFPFLKNHVSINIIMHYIDCIN